MGEPKDELARSDFDRYFMFQLRGSAITADARLPAYGELNNSL